MASAATASGDVPIAPAGRACTPLRVAVLGYGSLGSYLCDKLREHPESYTLVAVWNRNVDRLDRVPAHLRCSNIQDLVAGSFAVDLIVEASHPDVSIRWASSLVSIADYYMASPTALADDSFRESVTRAALASGRTVYVPTGAMWGAEDIRRMADRGSLGSLTVTMAKHPASLKLEGALGDTLAAYVATACGAGHAATDTILGMLPLVLYEGPVRPLCASAPNNVNTMAAASLAAHTLGFDGVQARLVADFSLNAHVVTIDARGKPGPDNSSFRVVTERVNPAPPGAVTGSATYASFYSSLAAARGKPPGLHLC